MSFINDDRIVGIQVTVVSGFGQHNAIACGLHYVTGHFAITMDDDLQNPPEEIPKLIAKIDEGYDVVYGAMEKKHANALRKAGSNFFHFLNRVIFRLSHSFQRDRR